MAVKRVYMVKLVLPKGWKKWFTVATDRRAKNPYLDLNLPSVASLLYLTPISHLC